MEQLQVPSEPFEEVFVPTIKLEPLDCLPQNSDMEDIAVKTEPLDDTVTPEIKCFEDVLISKTDIEENDSEPTEDPLNCLPQSSEKTRKPADYDGRILKNLNCSQCGLKYTNPEMLAWHTRNCHGPDAIVKIEKIGHTHYKFQCVFCETLCKTISLMVKHLQSKHQIKNLPFRCNNCDKTYTSRHYAKSHQLTCKDKKNCCVYATVNRKKKVKGMDCKLCNKTLKTEKLLQEHVSKFHAKLKEHYECLHCTETFNLLLDLKSHCQSVHPGAMIRKCEVCHTGFKSYQGYWNHKKFKHKAPTIRCKICSATFSFPSSMRSHVILMHSMQQKSVSCKLCGATFKCKQYLYKHARAMHSSPILYCEHCKYKTCWKSSITIHMKHQHIGVKIESKPETAN